MKCKQCQKDVPQVEGRRKREFCNNTCKSRFWYSENKKKPKEDENGFLKIKGKGELSGYTFNIKQNHPPKITNLNKKQMPMGLSITEQIQWRIDNP